MTAQPEAPHAETRGDHRCRLRWWTHTSPALRRTERKHARLRRWRLLTRGSSPAAHTKPGRPVSPSKKHRQDEKDHADRSATPQTSARASIDCAQYLETALCPSSHE